MTARVSTSDNLFDYFRDQVDRAQLDTAIPVSTDISLYLASLLADRARADRPRVEDGATTLVELHALAQGQPPAARARTYRELGDRALYVLGYFRESLERRAVGPTYYEEMGSAAYHQVDRVFKRWFSDAFGPLFQELSVGFRGCVELLRDVRRVQDAQPDVLGRLYAEWLSTGSDEVAGRLRRLGLVVRAGGPDPSA